MTRRDLSNCWVTDPSFIIGFFVYLGCPLADPRASSTLQSAKRHGTSTSNRGTGSHNDGSRRPEGRARRGTSACQRIVKRGQEHKMSAAIVRSESAHVLFRPPGDYSIILYAAAYRRCSRGRRRLRGLLRCSATVYASTIVRRQHTGAPRAHSDTRNGSKEQ